MDPSKFTELVEHTHQALRCYLAGCGLNSANIDDVAQDAYLAYYQHPERRPREVDELTWLRGIARKLAIDMHRKQGRRGDHFDRIMHHFSKLKESQDQSADIWQGRREALTHCMGKMSERARSLLELVYREDVAVPDIASRLDKSADAVHMQLVRARRALRNCIDRSAS